MSEPKFTPGPWEPVGNPANRMFGVRSVRDFSPILRFLLPHRTEANARLIAAAPEEDEALEMAVHWWHAVGARLCVQSREPVPSWLVKGEAALMKARGGL
jgi:hypothetical protein